MKIKVKVHSNSRQEKITKIKKDLYEVWIKEKPINDKANKVLEKCLKEYFNAEAKIISGFNSRTKLIKVED
jgi:uncharacterized protein (TIGR00251 family)